MVIPAVVVSNTCSNSPAYRLTSVDVPDSETITTLVEHAQQLH